MKLTGKQEKFCDYYTETGNATEAYRRAYDCSTMTNKALWVKASQLLSQDKVRLRVEELQKEMRDKSIFTKEDILKELKCIVFADVRDFMEIKDGVVTFKNSEEWTYEMAHAVESVKTTATGIEIKLNGKSWSISRVCKMLGYDEPTKVDIKNMLLDIDTGTDG